MSKQQRTGDWGASRRSRGPIANTSLTSRSQGHSNGYRTNGARQILSILWMRRYWSDASCSPRTAYDRPVGVFSIQHLDVLSFERS
jgi:hypothetical protein